MQIYLLFPVIRWVLKKTEGYHAWLFGVALAYQVWLTIGLHYKVGRHGNGLIAQFLNGAGLGYWITTYVLYVVAGALAGWHFEKLCEFTRRHLRSGWRVALVAATGVAAGIGVYLIETEVYGATPNNASAVFQPVVVFEALAFGWALLGAGLLWSDRGAPGKKFAAAGSASSFGIYLAHPLVLQGLLLVIGSSYLGADGGLLGALHRLQPLQHRSAGAAVHRGAAHLRRELGAGLGGAAHPGQPAAHRARVEAEAQVPARPGDRPGAGQDRGQDRRRGRARLPAPGVIAPRASWSWRSPGRSPRPTSSAWSTAR